MKCATSSNMVKTFLFLALNRIAEHSNQIVDKDMLVSVHVSFSVRCLRRLKQWVITLLPEQDMFSRHICILDCNESCGRRIYLNQIWCSRAICDAKKTATRHHSHWNHWSVSDPQWYPNERTPLVFKFNGIYEGAEEILVTSTDVVWETSMREFWDSPFSDRNVEKL